jgi:hypothetical protein
MPSGGTVIWQSPGLMVWRVGNRYVVDANGGSVNLDHAQARVLAGLLEGSVYADERQAAIWQRIGPSEVKGA